MRKLVYVLPAVLITGCSMTDQPSGFFGNAGQSGYYNSSCQAVTCDAGQTYSASNYAGSAYSGQIPSNYAAQTYTQTAPTYTQAAPAPTYVQAAQLPTYTQTVQAPSYVQAAPSYVQAAPTYAAPTNTYYNVAQSSVNSPVLRGATGFGTAYGLRGFQNQNRGNFYGTLGGVWYDTDIDSFGLEGRLGYDSGRILGAEVEGSIGLFDDDSAALIGGNPVEIDTGFDYNLAAFAIARTPVFNGLSAHVRGGYDFRQLEVTATDAAGNIVRAEDNLDGFAYGVGAEYALSRNDGIRVDYTRYENDAFDTDSISASYVRKF